MSGGNSHRHGWTVGTILALTIAVPPPWGRSEVPACAEGKGAKTACALSPVGAPRDRHVDRLPPELDGRAQIVRADTLAANDAPGATATVLTKSTRRGQVVSIPRADTPLIRVISDEAVERGIAASGTVVEVPVFYMSNTCVSRFSPAVCMMDDSEGNLMAQRMIFGNGWTPGDELLAYEAEVFVSGSTSADDSVMTDLTLELWDADPLEVFDTTCMRGAAAAPYAGTLCTFSDLPEDHTYRLRCDVPGTTIAYDRAFAVLTVERGCQVHWSVPCRWNPDEPGDMFGRPLDIGDGNGWEVVYACEQDGSCDTANGLSAGVCCEDNTVACDHTDGTRECFQPTHCGDHVADSWFGVSAPFLGVDDYFNFVGAAYAEANVIMQVIPVSVDAPPPNTPADVLISGNDVTIDQHYPGGIRHLWFELYASDWDPNHTGLNLKAWQAGIDSSGYQAGISCGLTPWQPPCTTTADCAAALGPQGVGALAGLCSHGWEFPTNVCMAGWANDTRTDFIFHNVAHLGGVDLSTLNYRYGATLFGSPIPSPHIGNMYLGSLVLTTDCDCPKGDFQVKMALPNQNSNMVDEASQFINLGVVPANIHFPTGQCCNLDDLNPLTRCLSDTVTRCECEQMAKAGRFAVKFDPTGMCDDECPGCLANSDCDDNNSCTTDWCENDGCHHRGLTGTGCDDDNLCTDNDRCVNGVCAGMPVVECPQDQWCDPSDGLCKECSADAHCDDNDACTTDTCSPATGCLHTPVDCNDGDICTTDSCDPASGCVHAPVNCDDNNACTMDACSWVTGCVHGPTSCSDGDGCTVDTCDPATGCVHTAIECDDESACTDDRCVGGDCVYEPTYDDALYCCYPADGTLCGLNWELPGDFDGDGDVDLNDFDRFQVCFGSAPTSNPCVVADLTCDCAVDASDVDDFVSALTGP